MSVFHSIRFRLQLWNGLMLALVLAVFGGMAWRMEDAGRLQRIDQDLERRVAAVRDRRDFRGEQEGYYYVLWTADGHEVARSASAPRDVPFPAELDDPRASRLRGVYREYVHSEPGSGERILVGREIRDVLAEMRLAASVLVGMGLGVFALGLAGGWWITRRELRPIADISATAAKIADGDLSRRIPVTDVGELSDLARVLNGTFTRLQESLVRQARFTADASHELRTPVTVLLTQTQSTLNRERSAAEYKESLVVCQNVAQRMRRLIDSLLTLARLDGGESRATRVACRLDRLAAESAELLRPLAADQGITLEFDLREAPCDGNAEQLAQVVANLVGNAIHYNRPGGSVIVRTRTEADAAILEVADTGEGIAPSDLAHVFDRFFRVDKARSRGAGHSGLGLAITKTIVEAHGGEIRAASSPGEGSTFTVRLPGPPTVRTPAVSKPS